jgi:hypothetical protein
VRINRNSDRQFMRTRERYVHVSARIAKVRDPVTGTTHNIVVRPGSTYRREA